MTVHRLEREQWIAAPIERVFEFFSDAYNLEAITPPWVHFRIHTPRGVAMHAETRIEYELRLAGIPIAWRTRIVAWNPPRGFVDAQERGPYALWEHTHRFEPSGDGVRMEDSVRWALPLPPLGELAYVPVRAALAAIFDFRCEAIRAHFGAAEAAR